MKTKALLGVTGVVELVTGVGLVAAPSLVTVVLLGARLDSPAADVVARIAGAALLSIGLTCWRARNSPEDARHAGLVAGVLVYDALAAVVLLFAAVAQHLHGIALWPAVALHAALAVWCFACLPHAAAPASSHS